MILRVADSSQVSVARRATEDLARKLGFNEAKSGGAALVATEMATNLLKHGGGGEIVIERVATQRGAVGLELISLDKGRGIVDLSRSLEDGFSTAGTPGNGLGAIRRQADEFAIFSRPGLGTAVMARLSQNAERSVPGEIVTGAIVEPYPGEIVSGDAWTYSDTTRGPTLLAVDGSGHGVHAEAAARAAVDAFQTNQQHNCIRLAETVHRALAPTRGAAIAIARVDIDEHLIRFVGIGNISAALLVDGNVRRMVSHNGTAGHIAPRIREFSYPYSGDITIVLHSDGVSAKWDMGAYPGLATSHPSLIAGILFRDHRRERDDASIVAMRVPARRGSG